MGRTQQPRSAECPQCGATFRAGRLACPECGSDAETGWKDAEDIDYESIDLPERYDAPPRQPMLSKWLMLIAAIVALCAFVLVFALRR